MNGLSVTQCAIGGFDKNFSYLIIDKTTGETALVDPSGDLEKLEEVWEESGLSIKAILVTHTHFDHIDRLNDAVKKTKAPVYVHERGAESLSTPVTQTVSEGDRIALGEAEIEVLYTPGHIADAVCYYIDTENAADGVPKLISGDTLFVSRCGKTTERDIGDLYESLERLKTLPDETEIYPGHDYGDTPTSTIGKEKQENPYLTTPDFEHFKKLRLG